MNGSFQIIAALLLTALIGLGSYVYGGDNDLPVDPYVVWGGISYGNGGSPQTVTINVTNIASGKWYLGSPDDYDVSTGMYSLDINTNRLGCNEGDQIIVSIIDGNGNRGNGKGIIDFRSAETKIDIKLKSIINSNKTIDQEDKPYSNILDETNKNTPEIIGESDIVNINDSPYENDRNIEITGTRNDSNKTRNIDSEKVNENETLSNKNEKTLVSTDESPKYKNIWMIFLGVLALVILLMIFKTIKQIKD